MKLRAKLIHQRMSISHKKPETVQDLDEMLFLSQELVLFVLLLHCHSLKLGSGSLGVISISD